MKKFEFVAYPAQDVPTALTGLAKTIFEQFGKEKMRIQEFQVVDQWAPGQLVGQASHTCWAIALLVPDPMGDVALSEYSDLMKRAVGGMEKQLRQDENGLTSELDEYGQTLQQQVCVHDFIPNITGGGADWYCSRCNLPLEVFKRIEKED